MKIGYLQELYPEKRCIVGKLNDVDYIKCGATGNIFDRAVQLMRSKLGMQTSWDSLSIIRKGVPKSIDVVHSFNATCDIDNYWCVTFESTVPRTDFTVNRDWEKNDKSYRPDDFTKYQLDLLKKKNCLAILALSKNAYDIQVNMLKRLNVESSETIINKMHILHPPQSLMADKTMVEEKYQHMDSPLEVLFVGRLFFRKGGDVLIDVLTKLKKDHQIHLTVVSSMEYGDLVSASTEKDRQKYEKIISESDWITFYSSLPNSEVLKLSKKAHIGCLPTLADTYGFSVLEMQACGCPVITTNIRALPEINNDDTGWICNLNTYPVSHEATVFTPDQLKQNKEILKNELMRVFESIFADPAVLADKAICSIERIKSEHDPDKYQEFIRNIYQQR